ncbi:Endoglucanase H precursor [Streptomyces sp. ADI96-02]|uniref:glycoside hydrolase family 26 protein n=1 Tax=unclassified Streptomyces TaxID=2593676 RepID=UPI000F54F836|nr:glycosyl hydrolase [Streptomyces sp. ADI96-02]RPK68774.1 Endoglucanase H precursor [Streptomyces sp. ADI96-02]
MSVLRRSALVASLALAVLGPLCAGPAAARTPDAAPAPRPAATAAAPAADAPYDVRHLLRPAKKYLGVSRPQAPNSMEPVRDFGRMVGKQPNLVVYYAGWGHGFDATGVRNAWREGALTIVSWEPRGTTLAAVAAGRTDDYVRKYAESVRRLNLPIAISFADEMNGDWEEWGTKFATPREYVAAWKRLRAIFDEVGATNVIWTWSPNIVRPVDRARIALKPFYPGDDQVDWVGIVGYFTDWDPHTFQGLFGPTLDELRPFTRKPMVILETASMPGDRRAGHVKELCDGVTASPDIVGFSWFDYDARADWRLAGDRPGTEAFRRCAARDVFGFDVRDARAPRRG